VRSASRRTFRAAPASIPVFATDTATALVPSTAPIESLVGIPVDEFVPPAGSGATASIIAQLGVHAARYVRIQGGEQRVGLRARRLRSRCGRGGAFRSALGPDADGDACRTRPTRVPSWRIRCRATWMETASAMRATRRR
jgi:hypothetical protein